MNHTSSLISKFSQQFQLPKNRFKERQNAPFCVFAFNFFSAVPSSKPPFQIASECTIHRPWFQYVLRCSNFRIVFVLIASECTIYCTCIQHFLVKFNFQKHRFKCARMHHLVSLVSKLSQQCQLWFIGQCFWSSVNTHYSLLSIYSRSYWPDWHTVWQDECLHYWICLNFLVFRF